MAFVGTESSFRTTSSYMSSHGPSTSSAVTQDDLDDDFLALMASDTFSLESRRDKDLLLLSSILQNALPNSNTGPHGPSAKWIGASAGGQACGMESGAWNGWRPTEAGAPFSGSYGLPAPSSSAVSPSAYFTSPQRLPSSPLPLSNSPESSRRLPTRPAANSSSYFATAHGVRAPAASRERDVSGRARQTSLNLGASGNGWGLQREEAEDAEMEWDEDEDSVSEATSAGSSGFSGILSAEQGLSWTQLNASGAGMATPTGYMARDSSAPFG